MADYSKQTVAALRAILKERGIASTGLSRKQQIIDRLQEADQEAEENEAPAAQAPETAQDTVVDVSESRSDPVDALEPPSNDHVSEASPPETAPSGAQPIEQLDEAETGIAKDATSGAEAKPDGSLSEPDASTETVAPNAEQTHTPEEPMPTVPTSAEPPPASTSPPTTDIRSGSTQPIHEVSHDPSVDSAEAVEDSRKRKRRSATPPVDAEDIARKRAKQEDIVQLPEDNQDIQKGVETSSPVQGDAAESGTEKLQTDSRPEKAHLQSDEGADTSKSHDAPSSPKASRPQKFPSLSHLSGPAESLKTEPAPPEEDDRTTTPALHPATRSLYIRNLMRPLQLPALRNHLTKVASGRDQSPDSSILESFHIDSIRTHAFITFSSTTHAARARTALHDVVWPKERDRKPLWIDFVPDDAVSDWISTEAKAAAEQPRSIKRWEVVYEDDTDGVRAIHQEEGSRPPPRRKSHASVPATAPASREQAAAPARSKPTEVDTGRSFRALDELFRSTTAKPNLYFLPVSKSIAEARMDALDRSDVDAAPSGSGMGTFSFEGSRLVEIEDLRGVGASGPPGGGGGSYRGSGRARSPPWRGRGRGRGRGYGRL